MNRFTKALLFSFCISILSLSFAFSATEYIYENSYSDFSDGYFYKTTSTVTEPEITLGPVADWYTLADSTFSYRKPILINSANWLSEYQIELSIDTKYYITTTGRMNADGSDIRFSDTDGQTLIPYWVNASTVSLANSTATSIWVKVPEIQASIPKVIYMYYNNPDTHTWLSDREAVDDLYEDWETGSIDTNNWNLYSTHGENFLIHTSSKYNGNYCVRTGTIPAEGLSASSYLETYVSLEMNARIYFYWACSCHIAFDRDDLIFKVNNVQLFPSDRISGDYEWTQRVVDLSVGVSTLTWHWKKDSNEYYGLDRAWIDNIYVRKYIADTPTVDESSEPEENIGLSYYPSGAYSSEIFDLDGENSHIDRSSWSSVTSGATDVAVKYRQSNYPFLINGATPTWSDATNEASISGKQGRYLQYKATLSGNGTTIPYLINIGFDYRVVPKRPSGFYGTSISSGSVKWIWQDNSGSYEDGFRIYSTTKTLSVSPEGFIASTDTVGLKGQVSSDTTDYIETGLIPNTKYGRYLVSYNSYGSNVAYEINNNILYYDVTTYAYPPINHSEFMFYESTTALNYYIAIPENSDIYNSTFTFTSDISTDTAQYYRIAFTTDSSHSFSDSDYQWVPSSSYVLHPYDGHTVWEKPEITMHATQNATWYLHTQTYNIGNQPSGVTRLGPYWFKGAPTRITDLTATSSTSKEGSIVLTWTAPNSDMDTGNLSGATYVIKKRQQYVLNSESQWNSAGIVAVISTTTAAGTPQIYIVNGLTPGTTWGFAIKTIDEKDNYSLLSTNIDLEANTRSKASEIVKLVFTTPARSVEVGAVASVMTIRAEDASGNPLELFESTDIRLDSDSSDGYFSLNGTSWDSTPGSKVISISQGLYSKSFYYKDFESGNPTITATKLGSVRLWAPATQQQSIIPAKAVRFIIKHTGPRAENTARIGEDAYVNIYANDGYNTTNVSDSYLGDITATTTLSGMTVTPDTHTYTSGNAGTYQFTLNNYDYAGPGKVQVTEVLNQSFKKISVVGDKAWTVTSEGVIKKTISKGSQWFAQKYSVGVSSALEGVSTYDGSTIWACGSGGKVVISTDSGQTWRTLASGVAEDLNAVYFVDTSTGYAVGDSGRVIKSTCAGETWQDMGQVSGNPNLYDLYFINTSTGFACGAGGVLFKTADGGNNWTSVATGVVEDLNSISFLDDDSAYMSGGAGTILKTINGGDNWSAQTSNRSEILYGIDVIDSIRAMAVGENEVILRTSNGGSTWALISSGTIGANFNDVEYFSASYAVCSGDGGKIYQTADGGSSWSGIQMTGGSVNIQWNALVSSASPVAASFIQGENAGDQAVLRLGLWDFYSDNSKFDKITVLKTGTLNVSHIQSAKLYLDSNDNKTYDSGDVELAEGTFTGDSAEISYPSGYTLSATTDYFFITYKLANTAPIGDTLGAKLGVGCVNVMDGPQFAKNNLPFETTPVSVVPSSCTVKITVDKLVSGTTEQTQGAKDIKLYKLTMRTDLSNTNFSGLRIDMVNKLNISDSDIARVNLYKDQVLPNKLVSSAAFSGSVATLSLNENIDYVTTSYYYITVDISPTASYSTSQDVRCALSFYTNLTYFTLDAGGANNFNASAQYTSANIKINVAHDTLSVSLAAHTIPQLRQSDRKIFLPIKATMDDNSCVWTKARLEIDGVSTAGDSDISAVYIYRDTNGNNALDTGIDSILGSGKISGGVSDVIFSNPELIDTKTPDFATYFAVLEISKRAAVGKTLKLKLAVANITLGGVDTVSGSDLASPTATIEDYPDFVNAYFESVAPRDERVNVSGVAICKMKLSAYCDAPLEGIKVQHQGTSAYDSVNTVYIYSDANGDGKFYASSDTVVGSGSFDGAGTADITFASAYTIYDDTATLFVVYDLNSSATPNKTLAAALSYDGFSYSPPNQQKQFDYYTSGFLTLLDIRTPNKPTMTLNIGYPSGKQAGGETVYFMNDSTKLVFDWDSDANAGLADTQYAIASYAITSTTDVPDVTSWYPTPPDKKKAAFANMNLKHARTYHLWVKAVSADATPFERADSVKFIVDLTPPPCPDSPPTDTSPKAKSSMALAVSTSIISSYWVSWNEVTDPESGVLYYDIQERVDTSPVWVTISSYVTTGDYQVQKDTAADQGKLFYYRVRAYNYAGSWGAFSESSKAAYLSLPPELIKDVATYPNPFDSRIQNATITFILNKEAYLDIRIYDVFGALVRRWDIVGEAANENRLYWDGTDENGKKVGSGMYILSIDAEKGDEKLNERWKIGVIH